MCGIRSANYQLYHLLIFALCGIVAAFIGYNWVNWTAPDKNAVTSEPVASSEITEIRDDGEIAKYQERIAELEISLAQAEAQINDLEKSRSNEWTATSELLASILDAGTDNSQSQEDIAKKFLTRMHRIENGGGIAELYQGFLELGASGEAGARRLCDALRNPAIPTKSRGELLGVAALFPYPNCMDLFVNTPPDIAAQEGFDLKSHLEFLAVTVAQIPTADASNYLSHFEAIARNVVAKEPENGNGWRMLGVLAFVHDRRSARQLFDDPAQQRASVHFMINAAEAVHNDKARQYVESVALNPPDAPNVQKRAEQILSEW